MTARPLDIKWCIPMITIAHLHYSYRWLLWKTYCLKKGSSCSPLYLTLDFIRTCMTCIIIKRNIMNEDAPIVPGAMQLQKRLTCSCLENNYVSCHSNDCYHLKLTMRQLWYVLCFKSELFVYWIWQHGLQTEY